MEQQLILEWKRRVGTQAEQPTEVDTTSSPTTVYLRKEIEQIEIEQESGNIQAYTYLETELTPKQYELYKADMEKPSIQATMQTIQDAQATQEMQGIDQEINTETVMQTLCDIQADIALLTE